MANRRTNKVKQTEQSRKSTIEINPDVRKPSVENKESERLYYCQTCGEEFKRQKNNFPTTQSPMFAGNNGYTNMCKSCTDKWFTYFVETFNDNEEQAMDRMAALFDWYYSDEIMAATRKISADRSRVSAYPSKMNLPQYNPNPDKSPVTYLNTIKNKSFSIVNDFDDIREKDLKVSQKVVKFWGLGFEDNDYIYLQDQYVDWTTRHECKTKAQEEVFKRLCFKQLEILKATRSNSSTKDLDKTYQDLLDTANLKPKQTNMDALSEDRTFGQLIRIWENEKPIPEVSDEFKDVDNIAKYISVFFLGHLAKMVGIKNRFSRMYEDEMSKYSVNKPEYEEDSEALFDAIFGGHIGNSGGDDSE